MIREDLSNMLIHLTKGDAEDALIDLIAILTDRALKGGNGYIKGSYKCVCLSEAPISKIGFIIASKHRDFKYRPYGLIFKKEWIYKKGGLPVIYQPLKDYDLLHKDKKHLHMTFDISTDKKVDFTWEREWRIKTDRLDFEPKDVTIILPDRHVLNAVRTAFKSDETDGWHYIILEDLGVKIDHGIF